MSDLFNTVQHMSEEGLRNFAKGSGRGATFARMELQRREEAGPEPVVTVSLATLKWWRELVDLNPQDLAPRMDDVI